MEDSNELLLRRYRSDIHSMCAAFPEPATSYKIKMEFLENFDDEVPFRRFGYPSLDSFLHDHPNLVMVSFDGKVCYKAKITEATQDIQSLIAKQKKKKKRGANKKGRGSMLQRGQYNRSFNAKNVPNYSPSSARGNRGGKSFSFSNRAMNTFPAPDALRNSTTNMGFNAGWGLGAAKPTSNTTKDVQPFRGRLLASPVQSRKLFAPRVPVPIPAAPATTKGDPATGVSQILRALEKCGGQATITKLNWAYHSLFGKQLDAAEMTRHFGTNNMRKIHSSYLLDKVELNALSHGQWNFLSKENAVKQREWDAHHRSTIIEAPRYRWEKPSVKELYDKTVEMLVNMFPETIPIDKMAEIYKRAHNVCVNPVELYCKNWDDLVLTTFKDKLRLTPNKHVALTPAAIALHNLTYMQPKVQKESKVKRVTAEDLGLQYSDEDEEEDDDDDDGSSLISIPSLPDDDLSDLFAPSAADPLSAPRAASTTTNHKSFNSTFSVNKITFGMDSSDLFYPRTTLAPPSVSHPHSSRPEKRSIFDRITVPGREIPEVRKSNQQIITSVFGHKSGNLPDIELPMGQPKRPSVFSKHPIPARPKSPENDVTDIINKELDKLELYKRDRHMDTLLETERAKEAARKSSAALQSGSAKVVYGFGESAAYAPAFSSFGKPNCLSSLQKNADRGLSTTHYEFSNRQADLEAFANATRSAQAILDRNNKNKEADNSSSYSLKNQLPPFGQRFEQGSSELTVSPGKFNVKFNGRSEQLSNLVRSRRNERL